MSQPHKAKPPLDVLQSMVNGILIEIGRALRSSDKENGRTFASASTRLQSTIPSAANNFHQALDDLEIDLLRARAVLQRDLDKKRAQRIAREAPVPPPEPEPLPQLVADDIPVDTEALFKEEDEEQPVLDEPKPDILDIKDESGELSKPAVPNPELPSPAAALEATKSHPSGTSPSTEQQSTKPVGLGINTETIVSPAAQDISGVPNSSIDSLFDIPDNENADSVLNFDDMDFSVDAGATQNPEQSQVGNLDLSAFGSTTEDFSMLDLPGAESSSADANAAVKQVDDIFADIGTNTGEETMDLDLGNMGMGDPNSFDDLFMVGEGDDGNLGNSTEMEHGQFDDAFFGLE